MSALGGKRILIVEDEPLVAMVLEDILADFGCSIVGPACDIQEAESLAREEVIDAAILDVRVGEDTSHGVAELLETKDVPFLVASGYEGHDALSGAGGILAKPYRPVDVKVELERLFAGSGRRA